MVSEIISKLNQQNTIDDMMPLTAFSDDVNIEMLEKQGYKPYFTVETWKTKFPDIDPKHILCPRAVLFSPSLIYYDPEHYICFDTNICCGEMIIPSSSAERKEDSNQVLLNCIQEGMKAYVEKDYLRLLLPIANEENGGIAIHILRDMLEREEPNPELYKAFLSIYTLCNCGAHLLGEKALKRLKMCKNEKQIMDTTMILGSPGEWMTIYRGQASESTPYDQACSWTTDINKAYFFASWRSAENSCILTGLVRKDDIIDFIDDRKEKEILVVPGTVRLQSKKQCVAWDLFQNVVTADMFNNEYRFPKESLLRNIMTALDDIYEDAGVVGHDRSHSLRVALMANYIFRVEILLPLFHKKKSTFKKACQDLANLSMAAIYHDSGRVDNTANLEHGALGYEKFRKKHGENKVVSYLTTCHCRSDEEARRFWKEHFKGTDAENIWQAFCIIKDADALDRVRFGNLSQDYLDVTTLRTETAKSLVPVAHQLVNAKIQ